MERVLSALPLGGLLFALAAAFAWSLTIAMAVDFNNVAVQAAWQQAPLAVLFLMWAVMMAAMMLPSFVPTVRCYRQLLAGAAPAAALLRFGVFIAGYLLLWLLFSAAAALLQQALTAAGALGIAMALQPPALAAALLVAAGAFQFSALKIKCLNGCRHPAFFFLLHWRGGARGAFYMGVNNGLLCLGCCVWLMLLLFVGGVMNLYWIVALALYVLAEKTLPLPPLLMARTSGALLLIAGVCQFFIYL